MYVKIFEDILDSSIWEENLATRIVWLTMLIMADEEGVVRASTSGIRRRAVVSAEDLKVALEILSSPDIDSKNQEYAGRRIEKIDGGWLVLNYKTYREIRTKKQLADAERQRRHRANKAKESRDESQCHKNVTHVTTNETESEYVVASEDGSNTEEPTEGEDLSPGTGLVVPTKGNAIALTSVMDTMHRLAEIELQDDNLIKAQATALFSYYCHKTRKRQATTQFTVDRYNRCVRQIRERGLSFCLYVCDGGVKHPHLNKPGEPKCWELDSFFPYNNADRLEKLVGITEFSAVPVHPLIGAHPELGGGHE